MNKDDGQILQKPIIVCLCGSTRFFEEFMRQNYLETMRGNIVLSVGFYMHSSDKAHGQNVGITEDQKKMLDELHKRKIDLANEILVINVGDYIGESTRSEIEYAEKHGKLVRYIEPHVTAQQVTAQQKNNSLSCGTPEWYKECEKANNFIGLIQEPCFFVAGRHFLGERVKKLTRYDSLGEHSRIFNEPLVASLYSSVGKRYIEIYDLKSKRIIEELNPAFYDITFL